MDPNPSRTSVTYVLVGNWAGTVSPICEDEVVVSSPAALSVRASQIFDKSLASDREGVGAVWDGLWPSNASSAGRGTLPYLVSLFPLAALMRDGFPKISHCISIGY